MTEVPAYEAERNARIERNRQRMLELNIPEMMLDFHNALKKQRVQKPKSAARAKPNLQPKPILEKRRSGRLQNQPAPDYNEAALDKADAVKVHRNDGSGATELYTEDHIKLLGDCKEEWTLFVDGYDGNGNRIYDKLNGQTCHQCRQKTIGLRTSCSSCQSLKGVFCGDCLYMRYGENILEANRNPSWVCPPCRGICNCSIHRIRQGFAPTGSQYRQAVAAGFKSVAHMVIMQNQAPTAGQAPPPEADAAAELAPPTAELGQSTGPAKGTTKNSPAKENVEPTKTSPSIQQKLSDILPQKRQLRSSKLSHNPIDRVALQAVGLAH